VEEESKTNIYPNIKLTLAINFIKFPIVATPYPFHHISIESKEINVVASWHACSV